jgi:IgGFc binding protein
LDSLTDNDCLRVILPRPAGRSATVAHKWGSGYPSAVKTFVLTLLLVAAGIFFALAAAGCNQAGRGTSGRTSGSTGGATTGGQMVPCQSTCDGDNIVSCDKAHVIAGCGPDLTCGDDPSTGTASCVTPCDPKALAHSYTGCTFYAVDLPQFALPEPIGSIAADQQFAVAVANPWMVPLHVTVERNDAAPGAPPLIVQVLTKQVQPRALEVVPLDQREVSGYVKGSQRRNMSLLTAAAYRITTDRPASVYQFNPLNNPDAFSNDASLLIPENALDQSYVVLGWPGTGGDISFAGQTIKTDKRSYVTIVATRDNTTVRVTPSTPVMAGDNVPALPKNMPYTVTLNQFETLNLEGDDWQKVGETDFTGTRIEADGPVAVWSGIECITVNPDPPADPDKTCCCDHLEEQLFPRSSLGQDYVVVRSEGRTHAAGDPEYFRVLALEGPTNVRTSLGGSNAAFTLQAGEIRQVMGHDDFVVSADKAVMVGQYQTSQDASPAETGDPSFALVPPVAQHRTQYIFLVPTGYMENWMLISIAGGASVTLDGQPVGETSCERASAGTIGTQSYDAVRCPVPEGAHIVESTLPFGLMVEGWGPGPVSYAYTGGMEFQSVNHDCSSDGDCQAEFSCYGGTCAPTIIPN